jgi:hypothetical protein
MYEGFLMNTLEESRRRLFLRSVLGSERALQKFIMRKGSMAIPIIVVFSTAKSSYSRGTRLGGFLSSQTPIGNWRGLANSAGYRASFLTILAVLLLLFLLPRGRLKRRSRFCHEGVPSATGIGGPEDEGRKTRRIAHATDGAFPDSRGNQAAPRANHGTNEEEIGIRTAGVGSRFLTDRR